MEINLQVSVVVRHSLKNNKHLLFFFLNRVQEAVSQYSHGASFYCILTRFSRVAYPDRIVPVKKLLLIRWHGKFKKHQNQPNENSDSDYLKNDRAASTGNNSHSLK